MSNFSNKIELHVGLVTITKLYIGGLFATAVCDMCSAFWKELEVALNQPLLQWQAQVHSEDLPCSIAVATAVTSGLYTVFITSLL